MWFLFKITQITEKEMLHENIFFCDMSNTHWVYVGEKK